MPGEETWLVGEWRSNDERKYYLSNLPADATLKVLAAAIKARWVCEQAHQQMKEELGLDHFEGRSWQGLHRHALMTMIAYAFLQHPEIADCKAGKKKRQVRKGPPEPTLPAIRRAVISALARPMTTIRCPHYKAQIRTTETVLPK
jgi:SRSO17 transposase